MWNIHNQNVAELMHCIIVFYMQDSETCFADTGICICVLVLLKPYPSLASPLNLESSWQPRYSTVLC